MLFFFNTDSLNQLWQHKQQYIYYNSNRVWICIYFCTNPFEPDPLGVLLLNDTTPRIGFWITYIFQLCTPMYQYIVGDCYAGEQLSIVVGSRCCFVVFPAHLNCHHVKFTPWAIFPLKISDFFFFFLESCKTESWLWKRNMKTTQFFTKK